MNYVYCLESKISRKLYIGYTNDLKRIFKEHNTGKGGEFTKINGPWKSIFYEAHINEYDARKMETFYKSGYGRGVLKDKLKNYLNIARSSNGRTIDSESIYLGSNPSLAT